MGTLHTVLKNLDKQALEACLGRWAECTLSQLPKPSPLSAIAIDGKTLRGSQKQGACDVHLLSAVSHGLGLTLFQSAVDDKTNKIKAIEKVFFEGTCLFDATLYSSQTQEGEHGRIETRRIESSEDLPTGYTGFPDVAQVFRLRRTVLVKRTGEIREETVYGLTSLKAEQAGPKALLGLVRGHWHIENKSHWVRDVVFEEDRSQIRCGSIPQAMVALRNTVIGLLGFNGIHQIAAACRRHAARPQESLALLGIPKTE